MKKTNKYPHEGFRPFPGTVERINKIIAAAKKRGERLTKSTIFAQAILKALPELEKRHLQ